MGRNSSQSTLSQSQLRNIVKIFGHTIYGNLIARPDWAIGVACLLTVSPSIEYLNHFSF